MTNTITKTWAEEILEANMEGMNSAERFTYLNDVTTYGCASGCVSGVIYTNEIKELFKANMDSILEEVSYYQEEVGESVLGIVPPDDIPQHAVWLVVELKAQEMANTADDMGWEEE
jgi:hypothetical protein